MYCQNFYFSSKSTPKLLLLPHVFIFNPNAIFYIYMSYHISWGETNVVVRFSFFFTSTGNVCLYPFANSAFYMMLYHHFQRKFVFGVCNVHQRKLFILNSNMFQEWQTNHVMYRTKYDSIAVTFRHVIGFPGIKPATFGGKPDAAHNSQ